MSDTTDNTDPSQTPTADQTANQTAIWADESLVRRLTTGLGEGLTNLIPPTPGLRTRTAPMPWSSNAKPDEPYGLDPPTREFIELGYKIGQNGVFDPK